MSDRRAVVVFSSLLYCGMGALLFQDSFEKVDTGIWGEDINGKTGTIKAAGRRRGAPGPSGRDGGHLDFAVDYCDDGSCYRSEFKRPEGLSLQLGKEYWFGFALRIPSDASYLDSSDPNIFHFQLHGGDNIGRGPVLGLNIHNHDAPLKWRLNIYGDDTPSSASPDHNPKWSMVKDMGDIRPGYWDDIVIRVKLEYKQTGFIQAWRNGQKLVDEMDISTAYNDNNPPYLKVGTYANKPFKTTGGIKTATWAVSYWQLKVGDGSSSFDEVSTAVAASAEV